MLEIIMAMAFMTVALLSVFWMNRASNQGSMDAYFEMLAFSLAREPIEVFRGFGYRCVEKYLNGSSPPKEFKIGTTNIDFGNTKYPAEAKFFDRSIELKPVISGKIKAIQVTVTVSTAGQSRASKWMSRNSVKLEGIIVEQPK